MRFVVIYHHRPDVQKAVYQWLVEAVKNGIPFNLRPLQTHFLKTQPFWPTYGEVANFPMGFQCEEIEVSDNSVNILRSLVIDVEHVLTHINGHQLSLNI